MGEPGQHVPDQTLDRCVGARPPGLALHEIVYDYYAQDCVYADCSGDPGGKSGIAVLSSMGSSPFPSLRAARQHFLKQQEREEREERVMSMALTRSFVPVSTLCRNITKFVIDAAHAPTLKSARKYASIETLGRRIRTERTYITGIIRLQMVFGQPDSLPARSTKNI